MNFLVACFLGFLSVSSFSADYEFISYEASDYKTFSIDEMKNLLKDNWALTDWLKCDGKSEWDIFHRPARSNPLKDSLRILIPDSDDYLVYKNGSIFNSRGKRVWVTEDLFVNLVLNSLRILRKSPSTRKLLSLLEESYFPLYIKLGMNSFNPRRLGEKSSTGVAMARAAVSILTQRWSAPLEFSDIGIGGTIIWHPQLDINSIEEDGVRRKVKPEITLAHELFHAFDSIRGQMDSRYVVGPNYAHQEVNEYRAVYFENKVRKELGLKKLKYYGRSVVTVGEDPSTASDSPEINGAPLPETKDPLTEPDLLDDKGESILIPAPCLPQVPFLGS